MESTTILKKEVTNLKKQWDDLIKKEPKLRTKDAAHCLGVSEAELVATKCDGRNVIRLQQDWEGIFKNLDSLGCVMALTRNEAAVHEKTGIYQNVSFKGHAGLVLDENIDLRVFHKRWGFGFAMPVENPRGILHSLQFFDKEGHAVHKIYLKDDARLQAYQDLVNKFRDEDQAPGIKIRESIKKESTTTIQQVEEDAFLDAWSELKDTHDFYPMLRKFKVERTDALEIAKDRYSWKVENSSARNMLDLVSEREVPIMVFVRNSGMIQIHSGPVNKIRVMGQWLNVLDPEFNLHLRQDLVHSSWIVEKPTEDGVVTSLELFDKAGEQIVTFFGARKPGKPELEGWKAITSELKGREVNDIPS